MISDWFHTDLMWCSSEPDLESYGEVSTIVSWMQTITQKMVRDKFYSIP